MTFACEPTWDFSITACGGLNENCSSEVWLGTLPLPGGAVWGSLGGAVLLDEVCHGGHLSKFEALQGWRDGSAV